MGPQHPEEVRAVAEALLEFAGAALVIVLAGTFLTRCGDAIADITKLGRLLVGSVLLAGATSLPELTVDISAARMGAVDLAVGDLMGSSLFNLLILAVIDAMHRTPRRILSRMSAAHALSATMSIVLTAAVCVGIITRAGARWHIGHVGAATVAVALAWILGLRIVYYDQKVIAAKPAVGGAPQAVLIPAGRLRLARAIAGYVLSAAVIVLAAPRLAHAAEELAQLSGLGRTFIGTTLLALSTSLPELVATMAAVRMGAFDLAVGNVFGSNSFNMVLLLPVDLAAGAPVFTVVSRAHVLTGLAVILVTGVAIMGQLYHVEKRRRFIEPDALMMILLILGALALVYWTPP